jgi:2-isopropylmalate synthase
MSAESVGLDSNSLVLGKHSGRHALRDALEELGYKIDGAALNKAFKAFKELADKKKDVSAMDLEAIVTDELRSSDANYKLVSFKVSAESGEAPSASVVVTTPDGETVTGADSSGDGTIECMYRAIQDATQVHARLREYRVDATTGGGDSLGEVSVVVELGPPDGPVMNKLPGVVAGERVTGAGQGVSSDVVQASAIAYIRAISNAVSRAKVEGGVAAGTATP